MKHTIRTKDGFEEKNLTPIRAIRWKCLECSNWQHGEVSSCDMTDCPLWPYRMGKNPAIKRQALTDEQKSDLRERLKKLHSKKSCIVDKVYGGKLFLPISRYR